MAPEILKEEPYNTKVDIWSLGATAVDTATGEPPYACENDSRARGTPGGTMAQLGELCCMKVKDAVAAVAPTPCVSQRSQHQGKMVLI